MVIEYSQNIPMKESRTEIEIPKDHEPVSKWTIVQIVYPFTFYLLYSNDNSSRLTYSNDNYTVRIRSFLLNLDAGSYKYYTIVYSFSFLLHRVIQISPFCFFFRYCRHGLLVV